MLKIDSDGAMIVSDESSSSTNVDYHKVVEDDVLKYTFPIVHSQEILKMNAVLERNSTENLSVVTVTSDEVPGTLSKLNSSSHTQGERADNRAVALIVAPLTYFASFLAVILFRRRRTVYVPNVITFVAASCGIPQLIQLLWTKSFSSGMEFFGAADIIATEASLVEPSQRRKYITALECLILAGALEGPMGRATAQALKVIDSNYDDKQIENFAAQAVRNRNLLQARELIAAHAKAALGHGIENLRNPTPPRPRTPPAPR